MKRCRFLRRACTAKSVCVQLRLFEHEATLTALVDSGNLLRDPVSGKSVIVVDRKKLLPLLPRDLAAALEKDSPTLWLSDRRYAKSIRLVPAKTATGERLLPAIKPQALQLLDGQRAYPSDYLVAIADLGESAAGFDAIVPLE